MAHHSNLMVVGPQQQQQQKQQQQNLVLGNCIDHSKPKLIGNGNHGNGLDPGIAKKILHRDPSKDLWQNSVFHVPLSGASMVTAPGVVTMAPSPGVTMAADLRDGLFGVAKFSDSVLELCRAGTRTSHRLASVLHASQPLGEVAGQFLQLQKSLEETMGEVAIWVRSEVDLCMKRVSEREDGVKGQPQDDLQVLGVGLAVLVQLQQKFYQSAADQLSAFTNHHAALANGLHHHGDHKPPSPGRPRKQPANHKPASQSQWYVPLEDADTKPSAGQVVKQPGGPAVTGDNGNHGNSGNPGKPVSGQPPVSAAGPRPVSQEELDVVIDMLSRATKYSEREEAAPPAPSLSRAPGAHLPPPYGPRAAQHRQSDSFISDPAPRDTKTNTWPSRPRPRASDPTPWLDADPGPPPYPLMDYTPGAPDPRHSALLPGFHPGPWSTAAEEGTGRTWPTWPNIGDGEPAPRHWASVADSSSCSDESSSNGELQQWMMRMNLLDAQNMKRRHSSGGEDSAVTAITGPANINKSVDNLMGNMDPKSTNTWPPKHPWVNKPPDTEDSQGRPQEVMGVGGHGQVKGVHRPLMPQWSDPLATRPLAMWDAGVSMSHHYHTMPPGGATMDYATMGIPNTGIPIQEVGKQY